jgi:hypothetical protein
VLPSRGGELEIAAGERPRPTDVALPEDISTRVREWAKGELAQHRDAIERWAEAEGADLKAEAQGAEAKLWNVTGHESRPPTTWEHRGSFCPF